MMLYRSSVKKCRHVRIGRPLMKGERPAMPYRQRGALVVTPFVLVGDFNSPGSVLNTHPSHPRPSGGFASDGVG